MHMIIAQRLIELLCICEQINTSCQKHILVNDCVRRKCPSKPQPWFGLSDSGLEKLCCQACENCSSLTVAVLNLVGNFKHFDRMLHTQENLST